VPYTSKYLSGGSSGTYVGPAPFALPSIPPVTLANYLTPQTLAPQGPAPQFINDFTSLLGATPSTLYYILDPLLSYGYQLISAKRNIDTLLNSLKSSLGSTYAQPNSMYTLMAKVRSGIVAFSLGLTDSTALKAATTKWLVDGFNSTTGTAGANAGTIQQNITTALTAGQSLNTTQTAQLRNYLFVFEEYYKSAGAMLSQITQIINQISQNMAR
jgi:hypothetical protein